MLRKMFQIVMLAVLVLASFASAGKAEAWSGCGSSYYVQSGDTLTTIAAKCRTTTGAIRQANPGLYNWVYTGQTLRMPPGGYDGGDQGRSCYIVQRGDTLKIIAARYDTTWNAIAGLNNIYNSNLIYVGQCLYIPGKGPNPHDDGNNSSYYTVQRGDTLRIIASRFGTSVYALLSLNPNIWNPNIIYSGMVLRVR